MNEERNRNLWFSHDHPLYPRDLWLSPAEVGDHNVPGRGTTLELESDGACIDIVLSDAELRSVRDWINKRLSEETP